MIFLFYVIFGVVGYQMEASPVSFLGTNMSAMKDEVSKKTDMYVNMLQQSAEECKKERVMNVLYICNS